MLRGWKASASLSLALLALLAPATVQADPWDELQSPQDAHGTYDAINDSFVLAWQAPDGAPANTTYHVYRDGDLLGILAQPNFTDFALPNTATWTYQITAKYGTLESAPVTLVVVNSGAISSHAPHHRMMMFGPFVQIQGQSMYYYGPGAPMIWPLGNETDPCNIIVVGGTEPPFLFSIDWACFWDLVGVPPP